MVQARIKKGYGIRPDFFFLPYDYGVQKTDQKEVS